MKHLKYETMVLPAPSFGIRCRDWLLIHGVELVKRPYTSIFKWKRKAWGLSSDQLVKYRAGSLGRALGEMLKKENLELINKLETHDIMHVLLEYDLTVEAEAQMQFVLFGNGKRTIFCLFSVFVGWVTFPYLRDELLKSYLKGRSMRRFTNWNFQHLLKEPVSTLRSLIQRNTGGMEAPFLW